MVGAVVVYYQEYFFLRTTDHSTQKMLEDFLGEVLFESHESHSSHIGQHRYHVATKTAARLFMYRRLSFDIVASTKAMVRFHFCFVAEINFTAFFLRFFLIDG